MSSTWTSKFQKALDSVLHARLLEKLKSYGISGSVLRWIQAFLSDHTQQVLVEGERSTWSAVTSISGICLRTAFVLTVHQ